ncbi:hypothetical protein ACGFZ9_51245 [Streptomyces mirabilis]|uniref:hypothetical protein n=1 Tax=Streptomyces mirabilis TaxID=68239 RepID=UPI00371882DE
MTSVAEITALLRPLPSPNPYPSVMVDDKQDASRALTAALQYFDADDDRQAVTVHLAGEELGLLHRRDAYSLPPPLLSTRDYGASDQAALPGDVRYEMINMRCPVTNCSHRFALILYPLQPPRCPVHPEQTVVVAG